jgi:hypothetical protein
MPGSHHKRVYGPPDALQLSNTVHSGDKILLPSLYRVGGYSKLDIAGCDIERYEIGSGVTSSDYPPLQIPYRGI